MSPSPDHPLVQHGRREALFVLLVWFATMVYTVSYCWRHGNGRTLENLTFVLGFPDWIFWGVVLPWFVCLAISTWFAFWGLSDDPLGDEAAEEPLHEDAQHG